MSAVLESTRNVTVVVVPGDSLVASNVARFKDEMESVLRESKNVVVDLHQVHFIDSSGCGALLNVLKQFRAVGGRLSACHITRTVRALFELIRMSRVMSIFPSCEEAIASVA